MVDNTTLPGLGDVIATDDIGGVKYQRMKTGFGDDGAYSDVSDTAPLPVKLSSLVYPSSTNNSSNVQLAAGASFTGTTETIQNLQAAQVSVICDQPYQVTINQYIDSGATKLVSSDTFTRLGGVPLNENITLPGDFFRVVVTNLGQATTTSFELHTTFGIMTTTPRALSNEGGLPVSINDVRGQKLWRTTFAKAIGSGVDTDFFNLVVTGSGMAVSQSAGNLVLTSGTTINSETILRSKMAWTGNIIARIQSILSQRIVNNNFFVELVDVIGDGLVASASSATSLTVTLPNNPFTSANVGQSIYIGNLAGGLTGVPGRYAIASVSGNAVTFTVAGWTVSSGTVSLFGWNYHQLVYNGATATSATYDCQRRGWNSGVTTATINTTASPGHMAIMGSEDGNAFCADQLVASTSSLQTSIRASRVVNIPEETTPLYLQLRVLNGSTAPASTTTWTVGMVAIEDYTPIQASITNIKPQGYDAALPVSVLNTAGVNISQLGGTTAATSIANGSTNRLLGKTQGTAVSNTDQSATAFAGAGRVNGTVVASVQGGGGVISAEVNVSALTLGTATSVIAILQESRGGANFSDIWTSDPITATGIISVPAIPVAGRRRWCFHSVGGTSTTVTVTITTLELNTGSYPVWRQFRDAYAASSAMATVFNSAALAASTFVLGTVNSATTPFLIEGTKQISAFMTLAGSPTVTTQPVVTLELSMDGTNWFTTTTTLTAAGNGHYMAHLTGITAKFARLKVTTAAAYSAGSYTISSIGINAVN